MSLQEPLPVKIRKMPQRPITMEYEEFRFKKYTYKGLTYSYAYAHQWLYKHYGKASSCELDREHVSKRFEWSNISHEYKLQREDWRQLCRSCHAKADVTEETRRKHSANNLEEDCLVCCNE